MTAPTSPRESEQLMAEPRPKTVGEEIAEIRVELRWIRWLALGSFGASALGQLTRFAGPSPVGVVVEWIGRSL